MLRLWPTDFEKREHISKEEKNILRTSKKYFKDGHIAVGIDPVGLGTDDNRMGMYISPTEGLVTFSIMKGKIDFSKITMYQMIVNIYEEKIYNRLLDSKMLIVRNGKYKILKFPYKHIILFHDEDLKGHNYTKDELELLHPYAVYKFFKPFNPKGILKNVEDLNIFSCFRKQYDESFVNITEEESKAIFERLAPEYTIILTEKRCTELKSTKDIISDENLLITGEESEYRTFWLDEYQVNLVNDMGKGHRVILANPGAGKSVILLSKAFKYASLCKESQVLLTCYNSNLADSYKFKTACADFGNNKNLHIYTLHALVGRIYKDILHQSMGGEIASPEEIQKCIDYVNNGTIKIRYKAIFIDEVQVFEPAYLDLCYALLDNNEDSIFLMAGDLNQNVRAQSRRGDAPWKKMKSVSLDFTGRVKYIEKNYRNSVEIGNYLNRMLRYMNRQMEKNKMITSNEFEYNIFEQGDKKGLALKLSSGLSRMDITSTVIKALDEIVNKYNVAYSDIAILYPVRQNKALNYYFQLWLTRELDNQGIDYCFICDAPPYKKVKINNTSGVVISSIASSLGLDFRAVIIAGLYPYNYIFTGGKKVKITSWEQIAKLNEEQRDTVQKQIREVYTACSRARELLYIVSDLDKGTPLSQLLISGKE